jgi:hypothetical protein
MNPESALIISDENFDGFIKHNPDNGVIVRATQPSGYTILNTNSTFEVRTIVNSFTSYNTDNTYTTL